MLNKKCRKPQSLTKFHNTGDKEKYRTSFQREQRPEEKQVLLKVTSLSNTGHREPSIYSKL